MKVVAIFINVMSLVGLVVTLYMQIQIGYYSDEHPSLYNQFDESQGNLAWICVFLFFALCILSLTLIIQITEQTERKSSLQPKKI